ncbi:uncharacterized protein LOC101454622 [Ceratitis capitata]|uniref:(Mediterranean fruit fly) hypothetical protein n=1 Tax=Ceratitis capitata TaxID=7213 RepID=W8BSH9_CERCA|nr:uncharacterized protein LOC101454622 [Ceratitis capitata]CAD7004194.1 unnamed protein product [Ceratitis capitata]
MSTVATMTNTYFWLYTVGLLLVWLIVIATATPQQPKSTSMAKIWGKNVAQEQRLEGSCKSLCEQCGCIGFYCGEQCLCEYDKYAGNRGEGQKRKSIRARSEGECIAAMQRKARTQRLPFEVLIQGPTNERFIRTAMQFEMEKARAAATQIDTQQKRSTIAIYQPYTPTKRNTLLPASEGRKELTANGARTRRGTDHLDWFSDFANTLVRPAPLRKTDDSSSGNKKREAQENEDDSAAEKPDAWFSDHPTRLLRPSPIFRRQKSPPKSGSDESVNETSKSQEESMPAVSNLIKDTIRNIKESEIGENLRAGLRDGTDLLHNTFQGTNLELFPKGFRNDFAEVFDTWLKNQQVPEKSIEVPAVPARTSQNVLLPWFRPVRFLERVQQALN